ncbi:MAG TPA: Crp/Fnr family transcriptional regulator [Candidimonas sp.]|nr:Crp/Fnr family transcriptional regulator [Candidimonas sp.]
MVNNTLPSDASDIAAIKALCVSLVPIFNHLPAEQLTSIAGMAMSRSFQRGEFIHRAGDHSSQLSIVHKGRVKIYRLSESGKEQVVRVLTPGDFSGELAIFSDSCHETYAQALEPVDICFVRNSDLQALLLKHPSISLHILAELARRLAKSEQQSTSIATEPVETRIALHLASLVEQQGSMAIRLPVSRKDLASYLGTTPESISRRLADFEEAGWIRQLGPRRIEILDLDALLLL